MINQFGVTGSELKDGEFKYYEITQNGQWAGDVYKTYLGDWAWSIEIGDQDDRYVSGYATAKEAIEAIKKHLTRVAK